MFGYVNQSGGYLDVTSAPNKGTTFTLFSPRLFCERRSASEFVAIPGAIYDEANKISTCRRISPACQGFGMNLVEGGSVSVTGR